MHVCDILFGFLLRVFALLVRNAAAGLARGLAGRLAFAAAAVLRALAEIAGLQGLDMFHWFSLRFKFCSHYSRRICACQG